MGLFGNEDEQAMDALNDTKSLYESIGLPDVTWRDLAPELYQLESTNYDLVQEDPTIRSNQLGYLNKLAGLADSGLSESDQAGFARARAEGNQMAKAGTDAAIANATARGVGGSGLEFAMREAANQAGSGRAQEAALDQASVAAQQRALYNTAYGNAMGQMRGQDLEANSKNTDIINQFNLQNSQNRQNVMNSNVDLRNQTQEKNNSGRTNSNQQNFNNQITRAGGIAQANSGLAQGYAAQDAAKTGMVNTAIQLGATAMGGPLAGAAAGAALNSQKKQG